MCSLRTIFRPLAAVSSFVCALAFTSLTNTIFAEPAAHCGSFSKSCSGFAKFCETCESEYYYLYLNQHACIADGKVTSESHSFSLSGALQSQRTTKLVGTLNDWIIWETETTMLAIPLDSSKGLYAKSTAKGQESIGLEGWFLLCTEPQLTQR